MEEGMKNWRFLTSISLYFENGTRYDLQWKTNRKSMRSVEWCHFQAPSTTPNPNFEVTRKQKLD